MGYSRNRSLFGIYALLLFLNTLEKMIVISHDFFDEDNLVLPEENSIFKLQYERRVKLFNMCSSRFVEIGTSKVNARGHENSKHAILLLKNVVNNKFLGKEFLKAKKVAFYVYNPEVKKYLCFSRKSKLISRVKGEKNRKCLFEEVFLPPNFSSSNDESSLYSLFRSSFNSSLYMGFDRKGKAILGSNFDSSPDKRCFFFLKIFDLDMHNRGGHGPKINANKVVHFLKRNRRSLLLNSNSR